MLYVTSASNTPDFAWLDGNDVIVNLTIPVPVDGWMVANHRQLGFYRVNYDDENWAALAVQLQRDHQVDVTAPFSLSCKQRFYAHI